MRRFLIVFALALFSLPAFSAVDKTEQHKATFTIIMVKANTRAGCSATAISAHVLLTAEHCNVDGGTLYLNQSEPLFQNGLQVTEKYFDKNDHMLMVVPGVAFKHFVPYDADKVRSAVQGEHIYLWGNPALMRDQYREGYSTGIMSFPNSDLDDLNAGGRFTMFAVPIVGGDSGSAVFSEVDGQLVGITTWGIAGGAFLGSYPLQFTQAQVDQAEGLGNFTYVPDARPSVTVNVAAARLDPPAKYTTLTVLFAVFVLFSIAAKAHAAVVFTGRVIGTQAKSKYASVKSIVRAIKGRK